ncbi:MAG: hypothetical protein QG673_1894 [Pseudomonadota bacterium]|nr:hypothetical protein [Pseudomonadota bacterium]
MITLVWQTFKDVDNRALRNNLYLMPEEMIDAQQSLF